MFKNEIQYTYIYGYDEDEKNYLICNEDLFDKKLLSSTIIKSIKIWFGSLPEQNRKSLLGIQIEYLNKLTREKKSTKYQGAPIEDCSNIEIKELYIEFGNIYLILILYLIIILLILK